MQLTHIEHIEDNLMEHPALVLSAMDKMAQGTTYSLKWDGAPSIVFGMCPATGCFFLGTKSVFNKHPKVNYTVDDILANHGNNSELASKLMYVFAVLKKEYADTRVLQADLLFCKSDVVYGDGVAQFTPNTLTYETKTDEWRERVRKASIGLAIHTEYLMPVGSVSLQDMSARPIAGQPLLGDDILQFGIDVDTTENISDKYRKDVVKQLKDRDPQFIKERIIDTGVWAEYKIYYNHCIREETTQHLNFELEYKLFTEWLIDRYATAMKKKKTHAGMKTQLYKLDEQLALVLDPKVKQHFKMFSRARCNVIDAKLKILSEISGRADVYAVNDIGNAIDHEGAVISINGNPMKIVDREEFSRRNFAKNGNQYKK